MRSSPRRSFRSLAACAFAAGVLGFYSPALVAVQRSIPSKPDDRTIEHVLNRLGFGARPGDVERVRRMGLSSYIDQQLHPERINNAALDERLKTFATLNMSTQDLASEYFLPALQLRRDQQVQQQRTDARAAAQQPAGENDMAMNGGNTPAAPTAPNVPPALRGAQAGAQNVVNELMQAKMLRHAYSERQLEEVLSDFWFNHFNVFVGKGQVRQYLTSYERDVIRPNVLGNFRDLLGAVAHSPAMLFYLDNFQSASPDAGQMMRPQLQQRLNNPRLGPGQRQQLMDRLRQQAQQQRPARGLNENYARELMELHTLGVDGGYTQKDVIELARILTGWTIDRPQAGGAFVFRPQTHDQGTKTLLGKTFGPDGQNEGERALDLLAKHPSTAHHIAYQLAQRFVADEPPAALVDRAAKKFLSSNGNIREVVEVIITSQEFFAPEAYRAKVKTPLEFVVSSLRATSAGVTNGQPLVAAMRNLGMPLYGCQPPTGYSMTADAWVNTGALLNRMNFAVQLVAGGRIVPDQPAGRRAGAPGPAAGQPQRPGLANGRGRGAALLAARGPISVDIAALAPDTTGETRDRLIDTILAGQASDATRQTMARADSPQALIALTLGSPEFQRR